MRFQTQILLSSVLATSLLTPAMAKPDPAALVGPIAEYKMYVMSEAKQFVVATQAFTDAAARITNSEGKAGKAKFITHTDYYPFRLKESLPGGKRAIEAVRALGYPETFIRMWEYYLCYCEAGFSERQLGDIQAVLARH